MHDFLDRGGTDRPSHKVVQVTVDPYTGEYSKNILFVSDTDTKESPVANKETDKEVINSNGSSNTGVKTVNQSNKGQPQGVANKDYIEQEYFTLEGNCEMIANIDTINIKAGDTVNCLGLGKYLSGLYFVDEITRTIDSNGYSHSIKVQKNGFGESLKGEIRETVDNIQGTEPERPPKFKKPVKEHKNTQKSKQQVPKGKSGFSAPQGLYPVEWS